ncbi:MAG: hypothetical protein WD512_19925 [Candidatus Paceibacterota bacterium]
MKFRDDFSIRIIPYSNNELIKKVYEQLKHGTIIDCSDLSLGGQDGISFSSRLSDFGYRPFYWVTNDERRRLLKSIEPTLSVKAETGAGVLEETMLEKYKFCVSVLLKLNHNEDVCINISQNEPNQFCPLLYKIIKNHDGTFTFLHHERGTHTIVRNITLFKENVESAFTKYIDANTVNEIDLCWGQHILFG